MLTAQSVRDFCAALASREPAPGGGGGAALTGALAAALAAMVCQFTIGRKRFQAVDAEMRALLARADAIRAELLDLIDADAAAYLRVVDAEKMPRDEPAQLEARELALQAALNEATTVPLRMAVLAADVLALSEPLVERGNPHLASDAGVAAILAEAALLAAVVNVRVNLPRLRDGAAQTEYRAALARLQSGVTGVRARVMARVESSLG